jgi:radical SAM superfamily enzyme YgiQ (UPF0313 family)
LDDRSVWASIEGLAFKTAEGSVVHNPPRSLLRDLDSLPVPAYDLLPMDTWYPPGHRVEGRRAVAIIGSRGCPYRCSYCATQVVWGRTYRACSPAWVVRLMNGLHRRWGFEAFVFYDDILTLDRRWTLALCEAIRRDGAGDFAWCGNTRVDRVDPELLRTMRAAGCFFMSYGIESGSPRLLKRIRKGTTVKQNFQALAWTREAGIKVGATFMIGLPTETRAETKQSIRFALRARPDFSNFSIATPLFKTAMMPDALRNGTIAQGRSAWELVGSTSVWVTRGRTWRELKRWQRIAVKVCRNDIRGGKTDAA